MFYIQEMVRLPAGEFMIGALEDDEDAWDDERPRHKVILTQDLLVGSIRDTLVGTDHETANGSTKEYFQGAIKPVTV